MRVPGRCLPLLALTALWLATFSIGAASALYWDIEIVDPDTSPSPNVGQSTSLAFDSAGNPRISYYDGKTSDLKYAAYDGAAWRIETVDTAGYVGYHSPLALDGAGNPRISYYEVVDSNLKYAAWNDTGWAIETVDSAWTTGWDPSLALDAAGRPRISYGCYDGTNISLKYAAWDGTAWRIETVEPGGMVGYATSLVLDGAGNPRIAYQDYGNGRLKYAVGVPLRAIPPSVAAPTNPDGDDLYNDVNGNGRADFADIVLYFNQMSWIAGNEPIGAFDCNGNGRIDFADVVWLFNRLGTSPGTPTPTPTPAPTDGVVIYLNKTVAPGCMGGYVVDGTTLMGDARSGDWVTINGRRYQFQNNQQFRFTVRGDQATGQLFVEHERLSLLTFNVLFEVRNFGSTEWMMPTGFSMVNTTTNPINVGVPSSVSISAINKNNLTDESTLSYRCQVCAPSDTLLRLDGAAQIDARYPPGDDTYLEFRDLHAVLDSQYGGGLPTMWIYLEPGFDYLLASGTCVSP